LAPPGFNRKAIERVVSDEAIQAPLALAWIASLRSQWQ